MKRKLSILASLILVFSIIGLGSLAFFTDSEEARNVITAGNIDITLHDEDGAGEDFPIEGVHGVMPGTEVGKRVYITNSGDNPAYVRVRLDKIISAAEGVEATLNFDHILLDLNLANWTQVGDWFYYNDPLPVGEATATLFTKVMFGAELGNDYQNAHVVIDVFAEAVQSENNGLDPTAAAGWPTSP